MSEHLSLGTVAPGTGLVNVEAWSADGSKYKVVQIFFEFRGLEEAIATAVGRLYFDGAAVRGLRFSSAALSVVTLGTWTASGGFVAAEGAS